ncbi:hypothetical protein DL240_12330 [Lujinxingia litoralis]|uniref:DUF465 domain-containing protein n=2 Tax=Lujinxingia litoralis TaxID=2211119 RepID=A0A328C7N2_9DELT|nr:hypothetical protein DL240_12330 [Lujinxingia litoralis]
MTHVEFPTGTRIAIRWSARCQPLLHLEDVKGTRTTVEYSGERPHTHSHDRPPRPTIPPHGEEFMQQRRSAPPPTSMTIDELRAQHQALEERLQELEALRSLSPEEQFETRVIKKRKLSIKDALRVMGAGEA